MDDDMKFDEDEKIEEQVQEEEEEDVSVKIIEKQSYLYK